MYLIKDTVHCKYSKPSKYLCLLCNMITYVHWITASSIVWLWEPLSVLQLSYQRCWVDARIGCLGSTEDLPARHSKWPLHTHTHRKKTVATKNNSDDHLIIICMLQSKDRTSPNPILVWRNFFHTDNLCLVLNSPHQFSLRIFHQSDSHKPSTL